MVGGVRVDSRAPGRGSSVAVGRRAERAAGEAPGRRAGPGTAASGSRGIMRRGRQAGRPRWTRPRRSSARRVGSARAVVAGLGAKRAPRAAGGQLPPNERLQRTGAEGASW
jgi:hypothetical protein